MALVSTDIQAFPQIVVGYGGNNAAQTFDASTDLIFAVFQIPATGTLANVHYRVVANTAMTATLRIELRTLDTTTGLPNAAGTLYGSSTSITTTTFTANTNFTAAVNATGATRGDMVALVFDLSAYTSGSFTLLTRATDMLAFSGSATGISNVPYQGANTTGATALAQWGFNGFGIEYGTDTYYPLYEGFTIVGTAGTATVSNSGTTRRGNIFRPKTPRRACGMVVFADLDGDALLRLRLASDDSILATATVDKDVRGTTAQQAARFLFDSSATVTLAAGTDYYMLLEGNSATSCTMNTIINIPEQAMLDMLPGGQNCYGVSYAGSYSTATTTRYAIGLLTDQEDDGTGGSSGGGMVRIIS